MTNFLFFIKNNILHLTILTLLLHFLKNNFSAYYFFIIIMMMISFFVIYKDKKIFKFELDKNIFFFYIIFLISLFYIGLISIISNQRFNLDYVLILFALGKIYISPLIVILVVFLTKHRYDYYSLLNIYTVIMLFAFLSILLQNFLGHIPFFGETYYHEARYGVLGYSSITGSVNSYGLCISLATLFIFFNKKIGDFIKSILIFLIFFGAILSMSKSSLINIGLLFSIMLFYNYKLRNNWNFFIYLIIFFILSFIFIKFFQDAFTGLFIHTTGIEIFDKKINDEKYFNIFAAALERVNLRWGFPGNFSSYDFLFGIGVFAGGASLGFEHQASSHNAIYDLYFIGGPFLLVSFISLAIIIQYRLYQIYKASNYRHELSIIFFISNNILLFNSLFFTNAFFHPVISFGFYLSIGYLLTYKMYYES